jgi:hypothetical protein
VYGRAVLSSEIVRVLDAPNKHRAVYVAALRCGRRIGGGELDEDFVEARLYEVAIRVGRPDADARRTIAAGIRKGKLQPRQAPKTGTMLRDRTDAILRVVEMMGRASTEPWRVTSHRKVLWALHDMAVHAGKVRLDASYREISERAGVGVARVGPALCAMEGIWVRMVRKGSQHRVQSRTMVQLLLPPPTHECLVLEQSGPWPATEPPACSTDGHNRSLLVPSHDLWVGRGRAWETFRALALHGFPIKAADLARDSGIPRSSIYSSLAWLREIGLVVHQDQEWAAVDGRTAHDVLATLDLANVGAARKQRYAEDRVKHRKRIGAKAAAKGKGDEALKVYSRVYDLARKGSNPLFPERSRRASRGHTNLNVEDDDGL